MKMKFNRIPPPDNLYPFVESIWTLESIAEEKNYLDFKEFSFFANPFPQIVFQYVGKGFLDIDRTRISTTIPTSHFYGQSAKPIDLATAGSFKIFGVNFYPYSIPVLFGLSSRFTTSAVLKLEKLFGSSAHALEEDVLSAPSNEARQKIVCRALEERATEAHERDTIIEAAVHFLISNQGRESIESLCKYLGYSVRQVERSFIEKVGISPKLYARIIRFHFAMHNYRQKEYESLSQLALDSGYSDQAHFIREFKQFSSLNPRRYFKEMESDLAFVEHTI